MIVLHSFFADNSFFVWGESSFGPNGPDLQPMTHAAIPRIPWDAGSAAVNDALKRAGIRHSRKNLAESTEVHS